MSWRQLQKFAIASHTLLASYANTPHQGMAPFIRTPHRTPTGRQDAVMMEAENQRRLTQSQTPLLGGENPTLHPYDFTGVTPKKRKIQTPDPLLTHSATPAYSFGMTLKGTPLRDELHINEDMGMRDGSKLGLTYSRNKLLSTALKNLPQPKNEYQIVIQPVPEENDAEPDERIEEDMSDRIAREKAKEEARQQALLWKRSKVLQRGLPRPSAASLDLIRNSLTRTDEELVPPTLVEQADEMMRKELLSLLEHDNAKYPLDNEAEKGKKKGKKRKQACIPVIEDFEENELKEADRLIKEAEELLAAAMGHKDESFDDFVEAHHTCLNDIMYFPTRCSYGLSSEAGKMEKIAALQNDFEHVQKKMIPVKQKSLRTT